MNALLKEPHLHMRPMEEGDLAAVLAVERAGYPYPWTEGNFRDCLRAGYCCWVLEHGGAIIGHGVLSVAVGEAHVLNVCVHPDWQGKGLGRRVGVGAWGIRPSAGHRGGHCGEGEEVSRLHGIDSGERAVAPSYTEAAGGDPDGARTTAHCIQRE